MPTTNKKGLALSGGGYRAAAFHVGTLRKLHQMGVLGKFDVISTISGGSITGAYYCLHEGSFEDFERSMIDKLNTQSVIAFVCKSKAFLRIAIPFIAIVLFCVGLLFTAYGWVSLVIGVFILYLFTRYQFRVLPLSQIIERAYDHIFFKEVGLNKLSDHPELVIGSTNLQTCRPFTFSKRKMGDSTYDFWKQPVRFRNSGFPVARAVMASSCVPSFFSPVRIDPEFFVDFEDSKRISPLLIDGGVYDNQGIHKLTQLKSSYECELIVISDAGNKLPFEGSYNNNITLLLRTVELFMTRIKHFQMMFNLYRPTGSRTKELAYVSLGWDLGSCVSGFVNNMKDNNVPSRTVALHGIPAEWVEHVDRYRQEIQKLLERNIQYETIKARQLTDEELNVVRSVSTNLTKLSLHQIDCLMRHAENLTELQVKLYCPSLFV